MNKRANEIEKHEDMNITPQTGISKEEKKKKKGCKGGMKEKKEGRKEEQKRERKMERERNFSVTHIVSVLMKHMQADP